MKNYFSRLGKGCALVLLVGVLVSACLFGLLKRGITLDHFRLGDATLKQVSLHLDKKLALTIDEIAIDSSGKISEKAFDPSSIRRVMTWIDLVVNCFDAINIRRIAVGETVASFMLRGDRSGLVTIKNPAYSLTTVISYSEPFFTLNVREFKSVNYRTNGSGKILINIVKRKFVSDLKVILAQTLPLELHLEGNRSQLKFEGKGTALVDDIRPIVELFALDQDIQPWITEYLKGRSFRLDVVRGTVPFAAPEKVFDTLYAKASVQDCEYSFESKLPAIKAHSVDVVFENGVLKIFPHQATYAGVNTGRSWLDIDFTAHDPILTAFIRTKVGLGDDILHLLDFYNIRLPFKQTEGQTAADLTLSINLVDLEVGAKGVFKVKSGSFSYGQGTYTVKDSTVLLVDDNVTIQELNLVYRDMVKIKVEGKLDILSEKDELSIAVSKFDLPWQDRILSLDTSGTNVLIEFRKNKDIETLTVPKSTWRFGTVPIKVDGFSSSVKTDDFSGILSNIHVDVPPYAQALLSGRFNFSKGTCNLVVDVQGWDGDGITLDQQHLPLVLRYEKGLKISSEQKSKWLVGEKKVWVNALKLTYAEKIVIIDQLSMDMENFVKGSLHGIYDLATGKGALLLDQLEIESLGKNIPDFSAKNLSVSLAVTDGVISAIIPNLGVSYQWKRSSKWAVHISALGKLYDYSNFLQRYNLNRGTVDIWKTGANSLMFSGRITYPYSFLVKNNIPVNVYTVKGRYEEGNFEATIDNDIHLHYADRMQITSSGIGYNFSALRAYLEDHLGKEVDKSKDDIPDFDLQADKTVLYLNADQNAPADQLQIHSENGKLTGKLAFGKGKAELEMNNVQFTLLGQDFGEKFLDGILKDSQFIGGKLSFYVSGLLTKFKGVVKIDDSVVKNGAVLNNIMAFISTVPDLITFSLPGYSLQGMPFSRLYAGFFYDNHTIDVKTFAIESNALDMTGTGKINLVKNSIKMNIDLISKTKKYISKIPLIGYLLVGDTKIPTITLNVEGKLNDPEVSTSVYKEIVKTPFDILLRTISLPVHLFDQLEEATKDSSTQNKVKAPDKAQKP